MALAFASPAVSSVLHDGMIACESEVGVGTTFTVTLPAERVIAAPPALDAAAE